VFEGTPPFRRDSPSLHVLLPGRFGSVLVDFW